MTNVKNMKQILDSCEKVVQQKLSNSVYGNFVFFWIAFHWNFLFSMFALDDTKILQQTGLLKNDYLVATFFNIHDWYFWVSWIMPFLLTYLAIWHFPKFIFIPAFKKDEDARTEKKIIRIEKEKKIQQKEKELAGEEIKKLEIVEEKIEKERNIENINPELKWEKEYKKFKEYPFYDFGSIIQCVYENGGSVPNIVSGEIIAHAEANGLITVFEGSPTDGTKIKLTEKGKFFIKRYLEDRGDKNKEQKWR